MVTTRRRLMRTVWVVLTALPLVVVVICVLMMISAARSTEQTDGPGMVMFSGFVTGIWALGLFGLLLWVTIRNWNPRPIAPGWYVDPVGESWYRYWDGSAWTPQVAPPTAQ
jgi:hypothetical protein